MCSGRALLASNRLPRQAPTQQPASLIQRSDQRSEARSTPQQPTETLKVNVNVVQLFFNVKDKHGALIPNLTKDDFDILEDGKPQTVKYFTAETNLPLTLGILIDSSGSQLRVLDMEKEVGGAFLKQILTDKDEAFVIDFNVDCRPGAGLHPRRSSPAERPQQSENQFRSHHADAARRGRRSGPYRSPAGTVLYDAVYLSAHDMLAKEVGRKAMILLTDGEDEGSQLKIKDAIEAAQKADAIVYVLLCADRGFYGEYGDGL